MKGSGGTFVNRHYTEHTVSHEMVIDNNYWDLVAEEEKDKSVLRALVSDGLASKQFTADDDGNIFWIIRIENDDLSHTNYKVCVDLEVEMNNIYVLVSARFVNARDMDLPKWKKTDTPYFSKLHQKYNRLSFFGVSEEELKHFRIDVIYAKVNKTHEYTEIQPKVSTKIENERRQNEALISGIAGLLENPIASDVILRDGNQEWKLHKNILASQSKVFAAMFSCSMTENTEGVVEIKDVETKTLDLMIKYIYNAKIDDSDMRDEAENLLILADRYDVPVLKINCEKLLLSQLNVENSLHFLRLGVKYHSQDFVESAKRIVVKNLSTICNTEEYKDFVKENVELCVEITSLAFLK